MKYLFLLTTFIYFSISSTMFQSNYTTTQSLAEQYYNKLEVRTNLPKMLNKFLDRKALTRADVPSSTWQDIKENVDYTTFKTQIVEIIPQFYSDSELQTLIISYANSPNIPITKVNFRTALSEKIEVFNNTIFINSVNTTLTDNGYSPLQL